MRIEGKVWGTTGCIIKNSLLELHRIECKKGGYCSKHKHQTKANLFFVEQGSLEVRIFRDNGLVDKLTLRSGDQTTVPANVVHQFAVLEENTIAYELYWSQLEQDDIVRFSQGGMQEEEKDDKSMAFRF
jgi:mannose-6-phosphate isomerase-like protein (cupin superfamily)